MAAPTARYWHQHDACGAGRHRRFTIALRKTLHMRYYYCNKKRVRVEAPMGSRDFDGPMDGGKETRR